MDVDAKREETDALDARYGSVDVEDIIDWVSAEPRTLGILKEEVAAGSKGETLSEGVMKSHKRSSACGCP